MILLKLGSVKGDSKIDKYGDYIACTDFSFEITREVSDSAKAGTEHLNLGIAELPAISISKSLDPSSCDLFHQSISGINFGQGEIQYFTGFCFLLALVINN